MYKVLIMLSMVFFIQCGVYASKSIRGNDIELNEFYDYQCPHCRHMDSILKNLQENNPDLTIHYRVTPILNKNSMPVAALALASQSLGDHGLLHHLLLSSSLAPTVRTVVGLIHQEKNLNIAILVKKAESASIIAQLRYNVMVANHYGVNGIIHLPILVFTLPNKAHPIVLYGEQPLSLLNAVVAQLRTINYGEKR